MKYIAENPTAQQVADEVVDHAVPGAREVMRRNTSILGNVDPDTGRRLDYATRKRHVLDTLGPSHAPCFARYSVRILWHAYHQKKIFPGNAKKKGHRKENSRPAAMVCEGAGALSDDRSRRWGGL